MGKIFSLDSPFVQFMNKVADIMWLNILFVICCIPVITIGASITAMYYVTLKMVRNEEAYITKSFFKSFRLNFKQATAIWLILLAAGGLLAIDYAIMSGRMGVEIGNGTVATVMQVLLITVSVFYIFTATFVFPVLSKFYNSIKNTVKNAFIMSIRHFPVTLACIAVMIVVALLIIYVPIMLMLSIFLLFSLAAYANSFMFVRVFDSYIPAEEGKDEEDGSGSDTGETVTPVTDEDTEAMKSEVPTGRISE
ncbi:MAG: DUF624 domain-containing protein [Lachnospiraceae bacterium]|nr:DUF624 domain-containing protein [Lachnospiraceae bacterium]